MKLSISNIAWPPESDKEVWQLMKKYGYTGLEIAPTRIFPESPYEKAKEAYVWSRQLRQNYDFTVPSMQSIWYGRQEMLFGTKEERHILMEYTRKAIDFAVAVNCKNLVFGCPKNRNMPDGANTEIAVTFFREAGDYAAARGTVIGLEANPPIYQTNFINDTIAAFELIRQVNSEGFRLNLDTGTMIWNQEAVSELEGNIHLINHVHISEPGLKPIEERALHRELKAVLAQEEYDGYLSVEMGKTEDISVLESKLEYVRSVFQ